MFQICVRICVCEYEQSLGVLLFSNKIKSNISTRAEIDPVDATLFAEQRLNNIVIKIQRHLLNWQCWWVFFNPIVARCWQRTVVAMLLEQEPTIVNETSLLMVVTTMLLSVVNSVQCSHNREQGAAQHCSELLRTTCNKLLTILIKVFIFARFHKFQERCHFEDAVSQHVYCHTVWFVAVSS